MKGNTAPMNTHELLDAIQHGKELQREHLRSILSLEDHNALHTIFQAAYETKVRQIGKKVFLRGLVEISNVCKKNCYYCGIRRDNSKVVRYSMPESEILTAAEWADHADFGSIVLQSGERSDHEFTNKIESLVAAIRERTGGRLGITLALGEQSPDTYNRWFQAGAHRYLLRIEASNPRLYAHLHPPDHSFQTRLDCLHSLRNIGYQTGTGVMIGLPTQTLDDLVDDLLFFRDFDIDMIGMGPYLVHADTPLAHEFPDFDRKKESQLNLGLKMIAAARLLLKDVNIASTTALQALQEDGRELGLQAGANVIMPNITAEQYRDSYQLYAGKPGLHDGPADTLGPLKNRIEKLGESIAFGEWGDPKHFFTRKSE